MWIGVLDKLALAHFPNHMRGSIIGANGLNDSVRDGKRCFPVAFESTRGKR